MSEPKNIKHFVKAALQLPDENDKMKKKPNH
jgi:hypothetical protein